MTELLLPNAETDNNKPNFVQEQNQTPPTVLFQMGEEIENPSPNSDYGTPLVNIFNDTERGMNMLKSVSKTFKFDDISTPLKEFKRGSSRVRKNKHVGNDQNDLVPSSGKSGVRSSSRLGRDAVEASGDVMDMSWSNKEEKVDGNVNCGPRWRSDDVSEYEEHQIP